MGASLFVRYRAIVAGYACPRGHVGDDGARAVAVEVDASPDQVDCPSGHCGYPRQFDEAVVRPLGRCEGNIRDILLCRDRRALKKALKHSNASSAPKAAASPLKIPYSSTVPQRWGDARGACPPKPMRAPIHLDHTLWDDCRFMATATANATAKIAKNLTITLSKDNCYLFSTQHKLQSGNTTATIDCTNAQ